MKHVYFHSLRIFTRTLLIYSGIIAGLFFVTKWLVGSFIDGTSVSSSIAELIGVSIMFGTMWLVVSTARSFGLDRTENLLPKCLALFTVCIVSPFISHLYMPAASPPFIPIFTYISLFIFFTFFFTQFYLVRKWKLIFTRQPKRR